MADKSENTEQNEQFVKQETQSDKEKSSFEHDEMEDMLDQMSDNLASSFYQTLQVLASVCTLTERFYEGSHSRYVSEKSALVAERLGFDEEDIYEVKISGLLHDIGKVSFRETLLAKYPSEMTQSELQEYMLHPELGYQILSKHDLLRSISEIVFQHHEKLDGSGFPRHLTQEKIHPAAAIISVVDTYHNMMFRRMRDKTNTPKSNHQITSTASYMATTDTKYRSAMNYLHKKKNILYAKKIVDVFTEIIQEERMALGRKTVMRIPVNKIETGMIFAEDYHTNYGLLIAARGETASSDMKKALIRFAEAEQIPHKILVIK